MLANARVLGHVFDPLSVFWCLRADGHVEAVVVEVHNTYGERHAYLLDVDRSGRAGSRQGVLRLAVQRRVRAVRRPPAPRARPGERHRGARPRRRARADGDHRLARRFAATTRALVHTTARHLFMTQRVSLLIRWHGIRLWLRRLPVLPRPTRAPEEGVR